MKVFAYAFLVFVAIFGAAYANECHSDYERCVAGCDPQDANYRHCRYSCRANFDACMDVYSPDEPETMSSSGSKYRVCRPSHSKRCRRVV